jgi:hypothetical protein
MEITKQNIEAIKEIFAQLKKVNEPLYFSSPLEIVNKRNAYVCTLWGCVVNGNGYVQLMDNNEQWYELSPYDHNSYITAELVLNKLKKELEHGEL